MYVDQPSVTDTISILRGLRERYELHHGVKISDSALVEAAVLSDRYIADRFLPGGWGGAAGRGGVSALQAGAKGRGNRACLTARWALATVPHLVHACTSGGKLHRSFACYRVPFTNIQNCHYLFVIYMCSLPPVPPCSGCRQGD